MTLPGDPHTAIEQLYHTYHRALIAYLSRIVRERETAEDLCQETFVRALRNWPPRDPQTGAGAWLYRIATNVAYDYLRRRRCIRFVPLNGPAEPATSDGEIAARLDRAAAVAKALAQVSVIYRTPLLLHCYDDRSVKEIAAILGCAAVTVRTRLYRARDQFRKAYGEES